MRDAILLADELTYDGNNECLIWNVFANRGLGYLADQGSADDRTDQVEDFSVPPICEQASNNLDAGVLEINSPESGVLTNNESISITVRNYGINIISNFDVFFQVNDGNIFTETINKSISSGEETTYTFNNTYDFSIIGDYEILAGTLLTDDEQITNNNLSIDKAIELTTTKTIQFAKRQKTWFRNKNNPIWLNNKNLLKDAIIKIESFLG